MTMTARSFSDAELCVKCGLCLSHCPTYGKALDENESPRGRLALIQAWAAGSLEATPKLLSHIDNCLLCRSCESVCPAHVPYGRLVDDFRAATAKLKSNSMAFRMKSVAVGIVLQNPMFQKFSRPVLGVLSYSGLLKFSGVSELSSGLPEYFKHGSWQGLNSAHGQEHARVALFIGCTAELADAETITAAINLLTRIGVSVSVPENQGCCGAMALHAGETRGFAQMQQTNRTAFGTLQIDTILTLASGCGSVLKEYPKNFGFSDKIKDISTFLKDYLRFRQVRLDPLPGKVSIHSPCTLKNVLKSEQHVPALLRRIPELQIEVLTKTANCCGAAGTYLLDHPEMANDLREDLLSKLDSSKPDFLATSNVGCAMHLRAGLKQRGLNHVQVVHPVVLLERQLRTD